MNIHWNIKQINNHLESLVEASIYIQKSTTSLISNWNFWKNIFGIRNKDIIIV